MERGYSQIFALTCAKKKIPHDLTYILTLTSYQNNKNFMASTNNQCPKYEPLTPTKINSVGRCVIPWEFLGKSVKHIFSCREIYSV